jgi:hypothetical protein
MSTTAKWVVGIVVGIGVVVIGGVLAIAALLPVARVEGDSPPPSVVEEAPPATEDTPPVTVVEPPPATDLPDGRWFGFATVNGDNGLTMVTIDLAEILTGEEARRAAVEAGVIEEGEDLPNDFFIHDPDDEIEILTLADAPVIKVLSATTPERFLSIDAATLESLFNGSYTGEPVYGITPDLAAPMNITVEDGFITIIESVYLP